jgi:hypothetical protein
MPASERLDRDPAVLRRAVGACPESDAARPGKAVVDGFELGRSVDEDSKPAALDEELRGVPGVRRNCVWWTSPISFRTPPATR